MFIEKKKLVRSLLLLFVTLYGLEDAMAADELSAVQYNNPGLTTDLGVGLWAWPLPMDWDEDGDLDLIVSCPDKPYSGTYFFENTAGNVKLPVFRPGVRVGKGMKNLQVSYVRGAPRVLDNSTEFVGFLGKGFESATRKKIYPTNKIHQNLGNQRFNVWSYVDYDGDGRTDILVGADDWGYYGWDDGFDEQGNWKRGPLHGAVYILRNQSDDANPDYALPLRLQAGGADINVYGNPMPNLADFDADGDLDLVCGEFLDGFTYFQNIGNRTEPEFAAGRYLTADGDKIHLHVQMITPTAIDWDRDGDVDIVCGDEDGRVALVENTGRLDHGQPVFRQPQYFQQEATDLKFGALVTPVSVDWDGDGDEDLVCGNTAGNIGWFENLDGGNPPRWDNVKLLEANGKRIHVQAGPNGSIQGPAEAKWGYTTISVADWNGDDLPDIVLNSIWGKVEWFENIGSRSAAKLAEIKPIEVDWNGAAPKPSWTWWKPTKHDLVTQWRTTPVVVDWDRDGLADLLTLDHEGYLSLFRRAEVDGRLKLRPGERIFVGNHYDSKGVAKESTDPFLRLNVGTSGSSGRRKLCVVDWDGDGLDDLLVNSVNANWLRNRGTEANLTRFEDRGPLGAKILAGHTTSPTTVDWNGDGVRDLLLGAEDGRLYYQLNTKAAQ